MNYIGHTRFSLYEPESGAWRLTRSLNGGSQDALAEYAKTLFSGKRLNGRFEIFLKHTLPTLEMARRGRNLLHIVSYSEELPVYYKKKLQRASDQYDWLKLDLRTAENRSGSPIESYVSTHVPRGEVCAIYRLDDDDILGTNYFDQLEPYLTRDNVGKVVSLGFGVMGLFEDGQYTAMKIEHTPKIALGLARIFHHSPEGKVIGPSATNHILTDRHYPVILDSRQVSFIHSIHFMQDTIADRNERNRKLKLEQYKEMDDFIDLGQLRTIFPTVRVGVAT